MNIIVTLKYRQEKLRFKDQAQDYKKPLTSKIAVITVELRYKLTKDTPS